MSNVNGVGRGSKKPSYANHSKRKPSTSNAAPQAMPTTTSQPSPLAAKSSTAISPSHQIQHERLIFLLISLIGNSVIVTVKPNNAMYQGILSSASTETDLGFALARARILAPDGSIATSDAPVKSTLIIQAKDVVSLSVQGIDIEKATLAPVQGERGPDTFRTDVEISNTATTFESLSSGGGRTLQKWSDEMEEEAQDSFAASANQLAGRPAWNQFETNERLFGAKTNYNEEIYTTKLDRSAKDFKDREKKAERLAQQILSSGTSNPHIAEERNQASQENAQMDEEDKYSGVQRGPNAYVPPGARKTFAAASQPPPIAQKTASTNANGTAAAPKMTTQVPAPAQQVNGSTAPSSTSQPMASTLSSTAMEKTTSNAKGSENVVKDFKSFVNSEHKRLESKKAQAVAKAKDDRLAEFKKFSEEFTLKMPVPTDMLPILTKDQRKQQELLHPKSPPASIPSRIANEINNKSVPSASTTTTPQLQEAKIAPRFASPSPMARNASEVASKNSPVRKAALPEIPSFAELKLAKERKAAQAAGVEKVQDWVKTSGTPDQPAGSSTPVPGVQSPSLAPAGSTKINASAKEFIPNPKAISFTPGESASPANRPVPLPQPVSMPPHPFFGTKVLNKGEPTMLVKEDFTPFKLVVNSNPAAVPPNWQFTGRSYKAALTPIGNAPPSAALPSSSQDENDGRSQSSQGRSATATPAAPPSAGMHQMPPHMLQQGGPYQMYYPPMGFRPAGPGSHQYQGGPMPQQPYMPQMAYGQHGQPGLYPQQMPPGYFNAQSPPMIAMTPNHLPGGAQFRKMSMQQQGLPHFVGQGPPISQQNP